MAVVIGRPGQSAKETAFINFFGPQLIIALMLILAAPFVAWAFTRGSHPWLGLAIGVGAGVLVARKELTEMFTTMAGSFKWARGADGEDLTAAVLNRLPNNYVVVHDFHPIGADGKPSDWNLDHVVVGPSGVFVVDTKNYRSRVVPASTKSQYTRKNVQQAQRNSAEMKMRLKAWSLNALAETFVVPVVVYVNPDAWIEKPSEGLVKVIPLRWLATEITERQSRRPLNPDEVLRITSVLFSQLAPHLQVEFRSEMSRVSSMARAQAGVNSTQQESASRVTTQGQAAESRCAAQPRTCPLCGGHLVERIAKHGPRSGKRFLGCSSYRTKGCRYVFDLEQ